MTRPTLHLLCGKIAAGKSTLAARLAQGAGTEEAGTVLIAEDVWLDRLFGDRMSTGADYVACAARLRAAMAPHIVALLQAGVSVVLDFPANTVENRAWMRVLIDESGADHRLHVLVAPDRVCLDRLAARNARGDHPFAVSEAQFHRFSRHFTPPDPAEGFTLVHHDAAD